MLTFIFFRDGSPVFPWRSFSFLSLKEVPGLDCGKSFTRNYWEQKTLSHNIIPLRLNAFSGRVFFLETHVCPLAHLGIK